MASKVEGLECAMCLDAFKDPTLLSCGHTFCKGCLEKYDEQHHLDHIVCPVCRKSTKLGENRVSGLTPNFSLKGLEERSHENVDKPSSHFCPLHIELYEDIFCEDCGEFMCITCYFDNHRDHKFKKKEELEGYLRKKIETLIQNSKTRKTQIEKSVDNAEQHRINIHCHLSKVEKEIKDEFAKKVTILQKNEEILLKKLNSIRKDTDHQLEGFIANHRKEIDHINRSTTVLRGHKGNNFDSDKIKAQHFQCSDLEKSLKKIIDEESMVLLKQTAESTRYCPSNEKLLALGHIEQDVKETTSNIPRVKSMNIVRKVDTPTYILGMSALSQDAVVVGYGPYRRGCDCISVTDEKKQHLKSEVGSVWDIAFLTDGRSVVSHDSHTICVYSSQDAQSKSMQYIWKEGWCPTLCSDQHDNIYVVNGNPGIYIFHGSNPNPLRVVPTGDIRPSQICVSKTGVMITTTCDVTPNTVTVFDREGHVGSSITASDDKEYLHAAVDSRDRVLVARVRAGSDVFRLTRYTLQGTTLIEQVTFKELKLPGAIEIMFPFLSCYMTSLTPNLIAFASSTSMYFIELPE